MLRIPEGTGKAAKASAEVEPIAVSALSAEYLKKKNLASLKAHLKTLSDRDGKALKLGGKKDELIQRILEHHGVCKDQVTCA